MSDTTKATKQAKHTPGPWETLPCYYGTNRFPIGAPLGDGAHRIVGEAYGIGGTEADDEANARLIAAAPVMLAALEDIAGRGPVPGYGSAGALLVRLAGIQSLARAALAAATGEG